MKCAVLTYCAIFVSCMKTREPAVVAQAEVSAGLILIYEFHACWPQSLFMRPLSKVLSKY